uniref:Uncharacterized protein n=1 Tax=Cacopsylla melanoneura TaxID=428564 RepID=A0A8D8U8B0_9HEMI
MSLSSFSTFSRYSRAICCFRSEPSVFCSMEEITRHEDRRAPTTFLYATDSRFRSSLDSSTPVSVTAFIAAAMSSYRSACSASLARCTSSSFSPDADIVRNGVLERDWSTKN